MKELIPALMALIAPPALGLGFRKWIGVNIWPGCAAGLLIADLVVFKSPAVFIAAGNLLVGIAAVVISYRASGAAR